MTNSVNPLIFWTIVVVCCSKLRITSGAPHPGIASFGSKIVKRDETTLNPCFLADDPNAPQYPFETAMTDLYQRSDGLNRSAKSIQLRYFEEGTDPLLHEPTLGYLKLETFIDADSITYMELNDSIADPVAALRSHASMMNFMIRYLEEIRTKGEFATEPSLKPLRKELKTLETDAYSAMCSLKIALKSLNSTLPDLPFSFHSLFVQLSGSYTHEIYRAYIALNDISKLAEFLKHIYAGLSTTQ